MRNDLYGSWSGKARRKEVTRDVVKEETGHVIGIQVSCEESDLYYFFGTKLLKVLEKGCISLYTPNSAQDDSSATV